MGFLASVFAAFIALVALAAAIPTKISPSTKFADFVDQHGVAVPEKDKTLRKSIYEINQGVVDAHNSKTDKSHTRTLYSKWAHQTKAEWASKITHENRLPKQRIAPHNDRNLRQSRTGNTTALRKSDTADANRKLQIPTSWDWSGTYLGPAEYMGDNCANSYSFAAGSALEGELNIKTSVAYNYSKQFGLDCTAPNSGCNGGHPAHIFNAVLWDGGIVQTSDYPWVGTTQWCNMSFVTVPDTYMTGWVMPFANMDEYLLTAAYARPVVSNINLDPDVFFDYSSGIVTEWCQQEQPNFFVVVVGWGIDYSLGYAYWKVRMSFGPDWGENGYIRLARDPGVYAPSGQCGLTVSMFAPYRDNV